MKKQGMFSAATVGSGSMPPGAGSTIAIEGRDPLPAVAALNGGGTFMTGLQFPLNFHPGC